MVGDRVDNDIDPAQKHGFQTWLLSSAGTEKNAGNWKQLGEFLAYSV
jgi:ribonucleotide monophosphatase NagD (HAD superfamily)